MRGIFVFVGLFLLTNVTYADDYFKSVTACEMSATWQSIAQPGTKFDLSDTLNIQFSAVYKKDLKDKVENVSKQIDFIKLGSSGKIDPVFLSTFDANALSHKTGLEGGCPGMILDAPSLPFSLSKSQVLYVLSLLGGKVDTKDPYTVTWKNNEAGNKCFLSPQAKVIAPDPTISFILGTDLRLISQAVLPVNIKDGLSYHLTIDCDQQ